MSPVSAPFWHAAGTRHASRCELPARPCSRSNGAPRACRLLYFAGVVVEFTAGPQSALALAVVPACNSGTEPGDGDNNDPDSNCPEVRTVACFREHGRNTSDPGADHGAGPHRLVSAHLGGFHFRARPSRTYAEPGVDPLVDLRAYPLHQSLGDRFVISAAQLAMRCRCCGDLVPRFLIHALTIRLAEKQGPQPDRRRRSSLLLRPPDRCRRASPAPPLNPTGAHGAGGLGARSIKSGPPGFGGLSRRDRGSALDGPGHPPDNRAPV